MLAVRDIFRREFNAPDLRALWIKMPVLITFGAVPTVTQIQASVTLRAYAPGSENNIPKD
jgi:hypothetical protein